MHLRLRLRRRPLVSLALVGALALGACGDDNSDQRTTAAAAAAVVPAETTVPRYAGDAGATRTPTLSSVAQLEQPPRASTVAPKVRGSNVPTAQFLDTVSNDVATYWQKVFNNGKFRFPKTTQSVVTRVAAGRCGRITGASGPPVYCQADTTIYLPVEYFERRVAPIGDAAAVTMVALLWGLRIQDALGGLEAVERGQRTSLDVDLGAICFAGSYMATVANRNLLQTGDVDEILAAARATGGGQKGTPEQRVAAFRTGFARGVPACQRLRAR